MAPLFFQLSTITLFFFLLSNTIAIDDSLVLDVDGNPLVAGSPYYVRTMISKLGMSGGLVVESKPNQPECPQYAGYLSVGWYQESPIMFYPTNPSHKYVHANSNFIIVFNSTSSVCPQGSWKIEPDVDSDKMFISTGGDIGNPTSDSLFTFETVKLGYAPDLYILKHCPSNEIGCKVIESIDFTDDYYLGWLGLVPSYEHTFIGFAYSFHKA
ncbi:miraculin-like [Amaranthus tricolor]|uniref:miraculin-like n=1 Tax=Amaranthus tricolor TaxID=29722 RepID=UPI002583A61B|nr:miraculin-like [Amaranthus tricolor]